MRKTSIAIGFATAMLVTPVLAGDFYLYGSVGQSDFSIDKSKADQAVGSALGGSSFSSSMDNTDVGYKLQAGYRFNRYFALEAGFVDLGNATYSVADSSGGGASYEIPAPGWTFSLVGIVPIGSRFDLFGKVGRGTFSGEERIVSGSLTAIRDVTRIGYTYGMGASFNLSQEVSLRAEYELFNLPSPDWMGDKPKIKLFTLGAAYKF